VAEKQLVLGCRSDQFVSVKVELRLGVLHGVVINPARVPSLECAEKLLYHYVNFVEALKLYSLYL